jgi:hypothetical protein
MVTVLVATDAAEQALAESALREFDIPFVTRNAAIQHLIGAGQIGVFNLVTGPPEIQVSSSNLERATNLIRDALGGTDPSEHPAELEPEPDLHDELALRDRAIRYARYSAVWAVLYLWGVGALLAIYFGIRSFTITRDIPTSQKGLALFGIVLAVLTLLARVIIWRSEIPF